MQKTRDLQFNFGPFTEPLYYASSSTGNGWSPSHGYMGEGLLEVYMQSLSKATSLKAVSPYVGKEVFSSSTRKRPHFNHCEHRKNQGVNFPYTSFSKHYYASRKNWFLTRLGRSTTVGSSDPGSTCSFADFSAASRRAWWAMQPRLESSVQMLNFIYELKDFKSLYQIIYSDGAAKLYKKMKKFISRSKRKDLKRTLVGQFYSTGASAAKAVASLRLTNEFAIKPFISDCISFLNTVSKMSANIQEEFRNKGKVSQKSHFSESVDEIDDFSVGKKNLYYLKYGTSLSHRFTATLQYTYNYAAESNIKAMARYFGLLPTQEVIWNALPFSFLVDYVLPIGDYFHNTATQKNVELFASQYCESILTEYKSGCCFSGDSRSNLVINGFLADGGSIISGNTGSFYRRRVTRPNKGLPLPSFKCPSTNQRKNALALAVALS